MVVIVGCVIFVDALVGEKGLLTAVQSRRVYVRLEEDLARAEAENARLRALAQRLREDPMTIEDVARRDLGLIKPDERIFLLHDAPPSESDR